MLRRFAQGFAGLVTIVGVAACASGGAAGNTVISIGPTFAPQSVYASNTSQNGVNIYNAGTASGSGPTNQIGGSSTQLNGPQYLAFDSSQDLFVTSWNTSLSSGEITQIKTLATGNVLPLGQFPIGKVRARGIADFQDTYLGTSNAFDSIVVGVVDPSQPASFSNELYFFGTATFTGGLTRQVGGPLTGLNVPSGVAVDSKNNFYVTNLQGASVTVYTISSPSPTPSPTATPTPSPTPSPTPVGATASPTPTPATPTPTDTPINIAPVQTIAGGASGIGQPTGIALDGNGNIYVSDKSSSLCGCPAILVFSPGANGAVAPKTVISGAATLLVSPTDVKVDSGGKIYVADSTPAGAGVVYVFASGASGNVAPSATYTSPGTVTGLAILP